MKLNGHEITGCGILETSLDGMSAKTYCIELQFKHDRRNGKGYDLRSTSLPRLAKQNDDIAAILPEYVDDNWDEGRALNKLIAFSEKYNVPILPVERKRIEDLKAIAAAKAAAKTSESGEGEGEGEGTAKAVKAKKTPVERIRAILDREYKTSTLAKVNEIMKYLEEIDPAASAECAKIFQRALLPDAFKAQDGAKTAAA